MCLNTSSREPGDHRKIRIVFTKVTKAALHSELQEMRLIDEEAL